MQQPNQVFTRPMNPTTQQIQKYLDENKKLIVLILNNQNQGNSEMCALYLNRLKSNLTYLASVADNQPQAPKNSSQTTKEEENAIHAAQAAMSHQQQPGSSTSKVPLLPLNYQQQEHDQLAYLQQQLFRTQMGFSPPQLPQTRSGEHGCWR